MADTRIITDAEWKVHRPVIEKLYEQNPLSEVINLMEQDHGFSAKKAQYTRKFKEWNLSKNSTSDKWKFTARKLEKRKREGKESDTYMNGKLVPRKKVQKETSRYAPPSYYGTLDTAPSPQTPPGVEVCTPRGERGWGPRYVDSLHIPWFQFDDFLRADVGFPPRQVHQQYPTSLPSGDWNSVAFNNVCNINLPNLQSQLPEQQWSFVDIDISPQSTFTLDSLGVDRMRYLPPTVEAEDEIQNPLAPRTSAEEVRSIFAQVMGDGYSRGEDVTSVITSRLDGFLPEKEDGELVRNAKKIFDLSSIADASLQLLRYAVFLSSNNLLFDDQIDKLLKWMIKSDQSFLIERLIKIKIPTVEIFLSHLLLSATRLQEIDMVLTVIAHGVDVNTPAGHVQKATALYIATVTQNLYLVRLLLNAGANPNASYAFGQRNSALQASVHSKWPWIRKSNHQLVQMLLDAGGDVNVSPTDSSIPYLLLTSATLNRDAALVRMLLKSKAEVNMMTESSVTALQAAGSVNDLEILQILVDAGADVNAPFGNRYSCARMAGAAKNSYNHLVSPIQHAVYHDNIELVQILLDLDADEDGYTEVEGDKSLDDIDEEDDDFDIDRLQTPLQLAVSNRNSVLVRLLLSSGADANAQQYGDTPLQIAARMGDVALVRLLLRNGAHVNIAARKNGGRTALQAAAESGNSDLVQILLDEGANVNALPAFKKGRTAIQAAAHGRHTEILRTLRELGADVNAKPCSRGGRTCLQAAAENGDSEMIRILLKFGAEVNAPAASERGRTALQAAIQSHDSASIDILLKSGADINAAPSPVKGVSALYGAIRHDDLTLARRLLEIANPNGATSRHPPIVKAARNGSSDLVHSLIEAGANVNSLGNKRETSQFALQAAVIGGNIEVIRILLKAHANVNVSTPDIPSTPLELAVEKNRNDMVRLLLANGANVNPHPHTTTLSMALSKVMVNDAIVEDLIAAGADVNRGSVTHDLPLSVAVKDYRLTKRLLDAGANVNGQCPGRPTALQQACGGHNADTIKLLLAAGADVNAPASAHRGKTALQAAINYGNIPIIKLLLQHGANCNALAAESFGGTALQLAAMAGRISVVSLLLRAGAEINAAPSITGGRTALEAAAEHGRLDVVSLLLKNDTDGDGIDARCQRAAKLAAANGHPVISRILKDFKRKETE